MNFFDIPRLLQFTFQDPATPIMEGIIDLHHNIFFFFNFNFDFSFIFIF